MLFPKTLKTLSEAKRFEQRAIAQALWHIVKLHNAYQDPLSDSIWQMLHESDYVHWQKVLQSLRQSLAIHSSPFLMDLALALFVGPSLYEPLSKAVENLPHPHTTLDLFSTVKLMAQNPIDRSGYTPSYYLRHPRLVWSAFMSTYFGTRLLGWLCPFDPRGFAFNASGKIFEERFYDQLNKRLPSLLTLDWTLGPTPTVGDHIASETLAAIEALQNKASLAFQHTMWMYINLQNRCGMSEKGRSKALFEASQKASTIFRLASITVDSPWYLGHDRSLVTLYDHKCHLIDELRNGLSPSTATWYAFSLLENEKDAWWTCMERTVDKAACLAERTADPCRVFHELVVLGLVRAWQAFCCTSVTGRVITTTSCKECADRGASVNAAFAWALLDGDEESRAHIVQTVLWGRPLLARQRLIERQRTKGLQALVTSLRPEEVRAYLEQIWIDSNPNWWKMLDSNLNRHTFTPCSIEDKEIAANDHSCT